MLKRKTSLKTATNTPKLANPKVKPKAKPKAKKLKTIPQLEKELWKYFSLAVRLRDTQANGMCGCVTCESVIPYYGTSSCHAGHFRSRSEKMVKYDFKNVHAQCAYCNAYKNGEQFKYGQVLDKKYGPGTAEDLYIKGKQSLKITRDYIDEKIEECCKLIVEHATEKNLWDWKSGMTKTELSKIMSYDV